MPDKPSDNESWVPSDRYYVQLALGQVHGVLHRAVSDAPTWLRSGEQGREELTAEDLAAAYAEACRQLGMIQAALNTAERDRHLADRGFSGAQLKAKLKGFWQSVKRYAVVDKATAGAYLLRMNAALGWCGTIVGSVASALEGEIKTIPGATTAVEGLKEFIELLKHAGEFSANEETNDPSDRRPGARKITVDHEE